MSVIYDSKKIIPAPFVNISKSYQTTGDGEKIGSTFVLAITGTLVAFKGSPIGLTPPGGASYGGFQNRFWVDSGEPPDETVGQTERLKSILAKQQAMRHLFATDGLSLEFTPLDGSTPLKCYPRIQGIEFETGLWYDRCEYTITVETDCLLLDGEPICEDDFSEYISAASETWGIDPDDGQPEGLGLPRTYRLTHSISATGKRFYDEGVLSKPAWEQAREFVHPRMGIDADRVFASGVLGLPNYYGGYNQILTESVDEIGGTYSVTETWVIASGKALESFNISSRTAADTGLTTVTIDGNVTGLEERTTGPFAAGVVDGEQLLVDKYTNAADKFSEVESMILSRAQDYSGKTLNIEPLSTTVGRSPVNGTIDYTYEYNTRPSRCITGSLSESIVVQDTFGADVFASIFVLGRAAGPVLQNLGAKQQSSRSLAIELVMSGVDPGGCTLEELRAAITDSKPSIKSPQKDELQVIVDAANPENAEGFTSSSQVFLSNQNESWDYITGRYTYNAEWVYEL